MNRSYQKPGPGARNEALEFRMSVALVFIAAAKAALAADALRRPPRGNSYSPAAPTLAAPSLTDRD
jgi:hypothetical protein